MSITDPPPELPPTTTERRCPDCQSTSFYVLAVGLVHGHPPVPTRTHECQDCGRRYVVRPDAAA